MSSYRMRASHKALAEARSSASPMASPRLGRGPGGTATATHTHERHEHEHSFPHTTPFRSVPDARVPQGFGRGPVECVADGVAEAREWTGRHRNRNPHAR